MDKKQLKEKLHSLKTIRNIQEGNKQELQTKQEEFDKANEVLIKQINAVNQEIIEIESSLREEGLVYYNETGEKEFFGMKVTKKLDVPIYNENAAIRYCIEKDLPSNLKLNKISFVNVAKALKPDFVKFEDQISVSVPKNIEVEE